MNIAVFWQLLKSGAWKILLPTLQVWGTKSGAEILAAAKEYAKEALTRDGWSELERELFVKHRLQQAAADGSITWDDELINRALSIALRYVKAHPQEYVKRGK
jgi:hypothetical protein